MCGWECEDVGVRMYGCVGVWACGRMDGWVRSSIDVMSMWL